MILVSWEALRFYDALAEWSGVDSGFTAASSIFLCKINTALTAV